MLPHRSKTRTASRLAAVALTSAVITSAFTAPALAVGYGVDGVAPDADTGESAPVSQPVETPDVEVRSAKVPTIAPKKVDDAVEHDHEEGEDEHDHGSSPVVAELTDESTAAYRMLGVTWSADSDVEGVHVEVRTRTDDEWTDWQELHVEGGDDDEGGVPGTEPLWVGEADGVAARVFAESGTPEGVEVSLIDPGVDSTEATASSAPASSGVATATTASDGQPTGMPPQPAIITRAKWGAAASNRCDTPNVGATSRGAVIHHTAGSNSYTAAQSASIVRGAQSYHMKSRKWCDIGYNFLVDKYGQIFEGRAGGIDRNVRAAHSGNDAVNREAMGVSLMGNFETAVPSAAMKTAVVKLVGWRLGTFYLPAKGKYSLGGKSLDMISGHRNVVSTACPGKYAYAWLSEKGGLRDRVETYLAKSTSPVEARYKSSAALTGLPNIGELAHPGGVQRTRFAKGDLIYKVGVGTFFVGGPFKTAYNAIGAFTSGLGAPTRDSPTASATSQTAQSFQGGGMYNVPRSGTYAIYGPAFALWASLGGSSSKLGSPRSSVGAVSNGVSRTTFINGYILVQSSTGKATAYLHNGTVVSGTSGSTTPKPAPTTPAPATTAPATASNTVTVPSSRNVVFSGHGYGHGIGMSQYGAEGAARQGVKYADILKKYYPGTALSSTTGNMRVLISADSSDDVEIVGAAGLKWQEPATGRTVALPTTAAGKGITRWRIVRTAAIASHSKLEYRTTGGWTAFVVGGRAVGSAGDSQFAGPTTITLVLPSGSVKLRGAIRSSKPSASSGSRDTVNHLSVDDYVRGVIAAEMPSSWSAEALRAQSVAARTYGVRSRTGGRHYDICSTTACQVYGGASKETTATNAAVTATAGRILTYQGSPAFTQFSSSSGGVTSVGSQPYLKAVSDPWDNWSGNKNHAWKITVKASTIEKKYSSIGTLRKLTVTKRAGGGSMGGRVSTVQLIGSKKTVSISGNDARWAFGLRSNWFGF